MISGLLQAGPSPAVTRACPVIVVGTRNTCRAARSTPGSVRPCRQAAARAALMLASSSRRASLPSSTSASDEGRRDRRTQAELRRAVPRGDPSHARLRPPPRRPRPAQVGLQPAGGNRADGGAGAHRRACEREQRTPARPATLLAQGGDRAVGDDSIDTRVAPPPPVAPLAQPRPVLSTHAAVPGDPSVVRKAFMPSTRSGCGWPATR
jgi:hypothetical protein